MHTQKRKRNPNPTLNLVIKSQESQRERGKTRPMKTNPEQLEKWQ